MAVKYLTVEKAAKRLGITERAVRRNCVQGRYKGAVKRGGSWTIPASADPKLQDAEKPTGPAFRELLGVSIRKRDKAIIKRDHIAACEDRIAASAYRRCRCKITRAYAARHGIGERTLSRWMQRYREGGILSIVDWRGGSAASREAAKMAAEGK